MTSAEIIQFPAESARDWGAMERVIRDILARSPSDETLHEAVVAEMKFIFESIPARFDLQVSPAELAIAQGLELHEFTEVARGWLQRAIQPREVAALGVHLRLCTELVQLRAFAKISG